jgi:exonuclease III
MSPSSSFASLPLSTSAAPPTTSFRVGTFNLGLGFQHKIHDLVSRCSSLTLDIIALQEIGDPALLRSKFLQYLFIASPGPSGHEAGVGLLISYDLAPRIRSYKRSITGRLIGVILEINKGQQLLIISAYMPSGLDHRSPLDASVLEAHQLYEDMLQWTSGVHQTIIMGDLNETLTSYDRYPFRPPSASPSTITPIQRLVSDGYIDTYRLLHPHHATQPGYTHYSDAVTRHTRSRIDYIWTRGLLPSSHCSIHIDHSLHTISHHRLLWLELSMVGLSSVGTSTELPSLRLPNLRAASDTHQLNFIQHLHHQLERHEHELQSLAEEGTPTSIDSLAIQLTHLTHASAFSKLPLTGSTPYRNKSLLDLERQRRSLSRLLHTTRSLVDHYAAPPTHSPEWLHHYHHCIHQHHLQWSTDPHLVSPWMQETQKLISATRAMIRRETKRLSKHTSSSFDINPSASIHRMLKSDALPSQLFSVIDTNNQLTSTPAELEDVMVQHFTSVFTIPPPDPNPLPHPPPPMLYHKPNINPLS